MTDLPRLDLTVVTVRSGAGPVPLYGHSDSFVVLETLAPARGDDGCIAIVVGLARSLGCWPAMASAGSLGRDSSSASAALRRGRSARAGGIAPHTRPEHARRALQELGPTSVKLGQIASTPRRPVVSRVPGRAGPTAGRRSGGAMADSPRRPCR